MTIFREFDGKRYEIELTPSELYAAYTCQQFEFDRSDIEDIVCGSTDEDVRDMFGITRDEFMSMIDDFAYEMRRYIDKYDMSWEYARYEAIKDVIEETKSAK